GRALLFCLFAASRFASRAKLMARFKKHVGLIGCGREQLPRRAMVRAPLSGGTSTACLCLCRGTEPTLEPVDNTEDSGALNSPHPDPWASPCGLLPDVVSCCRDPSGGNPREDQVARCPLTSSRDGAKTVGRRLRHLSDCMAGRTVS
ncbi:unnamed protein product, partial [Ixodes pacificus]